MNKHQVGRDDLIKITIHCCSLEKNYSPTYYFNNVLLRFLNMFLVHFDNSLLNRNYNQIELLFSDVK